MKLSPLVPARLSYALALILALPLLTQQQQVLPPEFDVGPVVYQCENVTIEYCSYIYPRTSFPNYRDQRDQATANQELLNFTPLIQQQCSNAIVHFLCSIYAPLCQEERPNIRIRPCRELCMHVRDTCEARLVGYGLTWPPHLRCENFDPDESTLLDFCPPDLAAVVFPPNIPTVATPGTDNTTVPIDATSAPTPSVAVSTDPALTTCPAILQLTSNLANKSYAFGGIKNCGVNCGGIYFTRTERNVFAPVFILIFSIVCVLFTLFAVATFLIERHRFHYPERPIIFISFCYLVVSVLYIVGAISKLSGSNNEAFSCSDDTREDGIRSSSFILQALPNSESTYKSASCIILFVILYFFHMASAIWWIVLTLTWFLAAALKWGEEAVEKLWLLYHIMAWGLPALQVILVLAFRLVDGDQLSGLCYAGNANGIGIGVFVFLPLTLYLLVGFVFLVIGFTALINIRRQLQRDVAKARKIGRLIMRVGLYSGLYILFNVILLILLLYEVARRDDWELDYLRQCRQTATGEDCTADNSPSFVAFLLKYISIFCIGISSTSWIFSSKTFAAWKRLFCGCCATSGEPYNVPRVEEHQYDIPNPHMIPEKYPHLPPKQQQHHIVPEKYGMSEKNSDMSFHLPHPHTAV